MKNKKKFISTKKQALLQQKTNIQMEELLFHVYKLNLQMSDLRNQINHLSEELALSKKVDNAIQQISDNAKAACAN